MNDDHPFLMLIYSICGSIVLFLADWLNAWGEFCRDEEGNILKIKFLATLLLFIGAGVMTFVIAELFFDTPLMDDYRGYRDVVCVICGMFGTMLIPALKMFVESVVDNRLRWTKEKLGEKPKRIKKINE